MSEHQEAYADGLRIGARRERAAVVAWLRKGKGVAKWAVTGHLQNADEIERGDHLKAEDGDG